jgi:hypothetical protein
MYSIDIVHLKGLNPVRDNTLVSHFAGFLTNFVNRIITCTVCTPAAMVVSQIELLPWNFPRWNKLLILLLPYETLLASLLAFHPFVYKIKPVHAS